MSDLAQRVAELDWYHTMDLPGGVTTPGLFDHRGVIGRYDLPSDLSGKRVLDVGTFDGFFAFELERRGAAEVVAIDLADRNDLDWPAQLLRSGSADRFHPRKTNFELAKSAYGSNVRHEICSVYNANPERLGTFDLVFVGSLLVHLRDPVRALSALLTVVGGEIQLGEHTAKGLGKQAAGRFEGGGGELTWWVPNPQCLHDWMVAAGFVDVRLGKTFNVPFRASRGGLDHTNAWGRPAPS